MKIIHTVESLHARNGGPSRTVNYLCKYLARAGHDISLISILDGKRDELIFPDGEGFDTTLVSHTGAIGRTKAFGRAIVTEIDKSKLVCIHDHGLWRPSNYICGKVTRERNIKRIVSPRGMLEPWALQTKRNKKLLAWTLYQRSLLQSAAALHATSEAEAEQFRRLGSDLPIAIIPNGVEWGRNAHRKAVGTTRPEKKKRQVLFLSRIHPKKGLVNLINAWSACQEPGWEILIVGPDEEGHQLELETLVRKLKLAESVRFHGPVDENGKWELYREADIFVLPTHSENFGVVVGEALFSGTPVITTIGSPWSILEELKCGWWIELGVHPLIKALRQAMTLSDEARVAMGRRGREYAKESLSWEGISLNMSLVYAWILGLGPRPECVSIRDGVSKLNRRLTTT